MFSGSVCGIEIYACLRDESGYQTKKIRATDKLLSSTKDKVAGFINCTYLADDAEFDTSENIADNKKEFYEINFCSFSEISLSALSDIRTFVSGCSFLLGSVTRKTPFAVSNSGGDGQFLYAHSIFSISVP